MVLAEMEPQRELSLKLKKLEILDQACSRGSVSSARGSLRLRAGKTSSWVHSEKNYFSSWMEDVIDDKLNITESNKQPCSCKQTNAKMKQIAVPKLAVPSEEIKPRRLWILIQRCS